MAARTLKCHVGVGPKVTGEALVTDDNFSARYDLDRIKGIFSRPQHKLAGQSYVDKILVVNTAKGGVASAWMLHEMASRGIAPKAILFNRVNPILAQGGALANMALCDRFEDGDVTTLIKTGDTVTVDPQLGEVTVTKGPSS
jgi:predicted aconitase with swiveling domain